MLQPLTHQQWFQVGRAKRRLRNFDRRPPGDLRGLIWQEIPSGGRRRKIAWFAAKSQFLADRVLLS
jgi:hypothetical protein